MKCEAKTSKKAWNNPLAPHARCQHEATTKNADGRDVCARHAKSAHHGFVAKCCGSLFLLCGCSKSKETR